MAEPIGRTVRVLGLLAVSCGAPAELSAQDADPARSISVESFASLVDVRLDRSIAVTETVRIRYVGDWNGFYRFVPVRGSPWTDRDIHLDFAGATDEEDVQLPVWEGHHRGIREFVVTVPGASNAVRTTLLRYSLPWRVAAKGDQDVLSLNATGSQWSMPIQAASLTLRMPVGVQPVVRATLVGPDGTETEVTPEIQGQVALIRLSQPVAPGAGLWVQVTWEAGAFVRESFAQGAARLWTMHWILITGLALAAVLVQVALRQPLSSVQLVAVRSDSLDLRSGLVRGSRALADGLRDLSSYFKTREAIRGSSTSDIANVDPWAFNVQKTLLVAVPGVVLIRLLDFIYSPDVVLDPRLSHRERYFHEVLPGISWAISTVTIPLALLLLAPIFAWALRQQSRRDDGPSLTNSVLYIDGAHGLLPQAGLALGLAYAMWLGSSRLDPASGALAGVTLVLIPLVAWAVVVQLRIIFTALPSTLLPADPTTKTTRRYAAFAGGATTLLVWLSFRMTSATGVVAAASLAYVKAAFRGEL